jgi:nucleoside phosphorylase
LESDLGNLNISDKQNIQRQHQQQQQPLQQQRSVDLYEWDGKKKKKKKKNLFKSKIRKREWVIHSGGYCIGQPVADPPVQTSTSGDQLLADEEFARQLAREDAEAAAVASNSATVATTAPQSVQTERKLICLFINEEVVYIH